MVTAELITFIEKLLARGAPQEKIVNVLKAQGGWSDADIQAAFARIDTKSTKKNVSPSSKNQESGTANHTQPRQDEKVFGAMIRPETVMKSRIVDTENENSEEKSDHANADLTSSKRSDTVAETAQQSSPTKPDTKEEGAGKEAKTPQAETQETTVNPSQKALLRNNKRRRNMLLFFVVAALLVLAAGGLYAYATLMKSDTPAQILEEAMIQSGSIYSATNAGMINATVSLASSGIAEGASSTEVSDFGDAEMEVRLDYTFTYDASQTVNPIGEGSMTISLSGIVDGAPMQVRAVVQTKLLDQTLYLRLKEERNIPLPDALTSLDDTWLAINLNEVSKMFGSDLSTILANRSVSNSDYEDSVRTLFADSNFKTWINRILVRSGDKEIGGEESYVFTLDLAETDIVVLTDMVKEGVQGYDDVAGLTMGLSYESTDTEDSIRELITTLLRESTITIAIGKSDLKPREFQLHAENVPLSIGTVEGSMSLDVEHISHSFNEPVLVQIAGDMITLDTLFAQLGLQPVIMVPEGVYEKSGAVLMSIDPTQCLSNPWEEAWIALNENDSDSYPRGDLVTVEEAEKEIIRKFFAGQGIEIHDMYSQTYEEIFVEPISTCSACSCAQGYTLYIEVDEEDVEQLLKFGFIKTSL